ncbi:MAG: polynucleotide kinase-phosphatase [Candidatus Hydrogenedentes bacterium]|nr:polynucleotide kinase-phosphatase [Candidatus Hydrogenedentota bacterium]
MTITIPELALVTLVGVSGSGKSTFARKHFRSTEVLSSDFCRGMVSDNENDQSVTKDAFDVLQYIASKRLALGRLTVIDATNVQPESRKPLVELARKYHCIPVAIVLDVPEKLCAARNRERADRQFGEHVVRQQCTSLRRSLRSLKREGFRHIYVLSSLEHIESAEIVRQPLWNNLRHERGPFDIVGDVHGCFDELVQLLSELGYRIERVDESSPSGFQVTPPDARKVVFLGDIVDRGPKIPEVLRLVMSMVKSGVALCVPGNHDIKLMRKLQGKDVQIKHGLAETLEQLEGESTEFRSTVCDFLDGLVSHYVLDGGNLVVAHAGMKESMQGRGSGAVRDFALFGETTGETDEFGLPVRYPWAQEYRGSAMVVYGHTPVPEVEWINRTINIDTGCVFGGKLTALRYPEREIFSVPALRQYADPVRPLAANVGDSGDKRPDDVLFLEDVMGKRVVSTQLRSNVTIREENAAAALEVMSRYAVDPRWLIYLPPTMSPSETSQRPGLLEYPVEAFSYFKNCGVSRVICEEKHMGSRVVVVLCRDSEVARKRFHVPDGSIGVCYTRTGRRFFNDVKMEAALLERVHAAMTRAGLWDELETDWICLDCELMPWSAKAQELLRRQYAPVASASRSALSHTIAELRGAASRGVEGMDSLLVWAELSASDCAAYSAAYRRYCWTVTSFHDLKLAPFHVMATEGCVHTSRDHVWHMDVAKRLHRADLDAHGNEHVIMDTRCLSVDVMDEESVSEGIAWWEELTEAGGEGMVIKPLEFIHSGHKGLTQPALKCRGREYLRIIYGPEYTREENLERLRARGLSGKRSLALREFALGVESLERFVRYEPLYRVHECAFGVLAMESEPVDPRL